MPPRVPAAIDLPLEARFVLSRLVLILGVLLPTVVAGQAPTPFRVEEATITDIHAAMRQGRIDCHGLVRTYLQRIERVDPAINSLIVVNSRALDVADSLDRQYRSSGMIGPLHCVPVIVKDNFQTTDLPTTAGSLSFAGWVPRRDAFMVRRLREAGAIILAKSNMAEFAFTPYETVSSILPGYTRNPYALDRVTAGSSGGTAAAVAASLGAVGLGTDTGNSIRGPSSHQALVGIRSTMGLTSRAGVVPLILASDIAGPMARTVADAVAVFQVVVGEDPADPVTSAAHDHPAPDYSRSLRPDGLRGTRLGVLRQAYERPSTDSAILDLFGGALDDLRRAGAEIVDPATIPGLDSLLRIATGACNPFKHDINAYLDALGADGPPVRSLTDIVRSGRFHPTIQRRLEQADLVAATPEDTPGCQARDRFRAALRTAVLGVMDSLRLDAFVYPTWSNPPRLIGDLNTPHGDNSQLFSPSTGFPSINVPMGYTRGNTLPAGLTLYGRPWDEATLIRLAYSYEQTTHHRRPPPLANSP
ncbi:MAG: Glutamyl-tRNA(Gln) amidotransferase subunit A [Gemmatimonadaceae bacterium]|nr:Glutamyl-tRNA(Gln) amidotransferase subunit A [Gemmatimonadaceae bacterium]